MLSLALTLVVASAGPFTADQCPAVFGDADTRASLGEDEGTRIVDVVERKDGRAVLHAMPRWETPKALRLSGVQLVRIEDPAGDDPAWRRRVAHVRVTDPRCPVGEYAIGVGAALGAKLRVVAVLDDSVLLERGKGLVRLGNGRDDLRMVWQSDFAITVADGGGSKSATTKSAASRSSKAASERLAERKERAKARAARKKTKK